MTDKEVKLIEMIRNNDNPAQALITAIEIIVLYQDHRGLFVSKSPVDARESVDISQA